MGVVGSILAWRGWQGTRGGQLKAGQSWGQEGPA